MHRHLAGRLRAARLLNLVVIVALATATALAGATAAQASKHGSRAHAKAAKHKRHKRARARASRDTTPPSAPTNLAARNGDSKVTLTWKASTDNTHVRAYRIYANGALAGIASGKTTVYTVAPVTNGMPYTFAVKAYDPAGNLSPPSNGVTVTPGTSGSTSGGGSSSGSVAGGGLDSSGQGMPVGNIPGWTQIWADNFPYNVSLGNFPAGTNGKWSAYPDGWHDTSTHGTYNCTKVCSVHDGMLDMWIHSENGAHYVAVPYPKVPSGITYGRYAVRFTSDPLPHYKTAWLLWPDSDTWPRDGEVDFPEGGLDGTICAYMHRQGASSGDDQDQFCTGTHYQGWHTAVTEWTPSSIKFYLDGNLIGTSSSRIPNTPMHWVLQTETEISGTSPDNATQGHVLVDWAAVYRPA